MTNDDRNPGTPYDGGRRNTSDGQPEYGSYGQPERPGQTGQYGYGQPQAGQNGDPYANPYAGQYGRPGQGADPMGGPQGPQGPQGPWNPQESWPQRPADPFKLIESLLPQRAKNWVRGFYAVIGVAAIALGAALLVWPGITLKAAAILLGAYFVVSGLVRVVTAIVEIGLPGGWRVLDILVGVLLAIGGVVMLKNAAVSGQTLALFVTLTVGVGWMLEGLMALVESWRLPSSGWAVLYAIVSIIAGFVVLMSPISSTVWLVLFGGCALVVMGVTAIVRAFTFGRLPRNR